MLPIGWAHWQVWRLGDAVYGDQSLVHRATELMASGLQGQMENVWLTCTRVDVKTEVGRFESYFKAHTKRTGDGLDTAGVSDLSLAPVREYDITQKAQDSGPDVWAHVPSPTQELCHWDSSHNFLSSVCSSVIWGFSQGCGQHWLS